MALPKGSRGRGRPWNDSQATGPGRRGGPKDARDVIRGRKDRPVSGRNAAASAGAPRILKTAHGLVTNKKAKGITTSQLKNRHARLVLFFFLSLRFFRISLDIRTNFRGMHYSIANFASVSAL